MARIVAWCGCLPLAVILADAQLRSHPTWSTTHLADLLAVEHERLEHLDVGDRSVQAAFDMSFQHRHADSAQHYGLVGMRERLAALGGTLDAGLQRDGWWRVTARLPLTAPTRVGG